MEERSRPPPPDSGEFLQTMRAHGDSSQEKFLPSSGRPPGTGAGSSSPPGGLNAGSCSAPRDRHPRDAATAAQTWSGDPCLPVPFLRRLTPLDTPNFLPCTPHWHSAAGRSRLGEEAELAPGLVAQEKLLSPGQKGSGQVPAVSVRPGGRGRGLMRTRRATHAHFWVRAELKMTNGLPVLEREVV